MSTTTLDILPNPDGSFSPLSIPTPGKVRVRVLRLPVRRVRVGGLGFRPNGSLVDPRPRDVLDDGSFIDALAAVLEHAATDERVVWAAVASESDPQLAEARLEAVRAWMTGETEAWDGLAEDAMTPELLHDHLTHLRRCGGWDCDPGPDPGDEGEITAALRRFQLQYSDRRGDLEASGQCDPPTLRAIFESIREPLAKRIADGELPDPGERAYADTGAVALPARERGKSTCPWSVGDNPGEFVDLLAFDSTQVGGGSALTAQLLYAGLCRFDPLATTRTTGLTELLLATDWFEDDVPDETFTLVSSDGSYSQTRSTRDDAHTDHGGIDLLFTRVPLEAELSLSITTETGECIEVFRDLTVDAIDAWNPSEEAVA